MSESDKSSPKIYCQLLSGDDLHSPIDLPNRNAVPVGRQPETGIVTVKCSRVQVLLTADFESKEVHLKVVGKNPTLVAGRKLLKNDEYVLGSSGKFQLISGYNYHVFFGTVPLPQQSANASGSNLMGKYCSVKRRRLDDYVTGSMTAVVPAVHDVRQCGTLIIIMYGPQNYSKTVAAFDLDGTIIETASGKKFAKDYTDWKLMANVKQRLGELHRAGYRIVMFTNQAAIPKGKPTKEDFAKKIKSIGEAINVPLLILAATGQDVYRKPCMGMWNYLTDHENGNLNLDVSNCFYVGDAAGRLAEWKRGAKKDFSCSDRKFADNIGIRFETPEEYFLGSPKCTKYSWGEFDPRQSTVSVYSPKVYPTSGSLSVSWPEVVVFVGFPASGKTTFYEKTMKPNGYVHVNRDTLGSWQKCVSFCEQELSKGRKIVVDNTNPDVESRKRYIECAKKFSIPVRCFQFMTTIYQAKHNNRFRELTTTVDKKKKVTEIAYNTFKSKFVEPSEVEGFTEILKITLNPCVKNEHEKLYTQFLL